MLSDWRSQKTLASAEVNRSVSQPYKQSTYQSNTSQAVRAPPRRIPMHSGRLGSRTYRKAGYRIHRHPGNVYLSGGQTSDRQRAEARSWNPEANIGAAIAGNRVDMCAQIQEQLDKSSLQRKIAREFNAVVRCTSFYFPTFKSFLISFFRV